MRLLSKKNMLIMKSFCLMMLLLAWFIFEINDPFDKFMTIVITVAVGSTLLMDIYDYRKKSH